MSVEVTGAPGDEPLDLDDVLAHLEIHEPTAEHRSRVGSLSQAAREQVEAETWRSIITQTLAIRFATFPVDGVIWVPRPPLQSVTSITYVDTDGATQTISTDDYHSDAASEPGWIEPTFGNIWPTDIIDQRGAITLTVVAGYGDGPSDVPERMRQAMLLYVADMWLVRESSVMGPTVTPMPDTVRGLLDVCRDERVLRYYK